jgi:hypothetical protein
MEKILLLTPITQTADACRPVGVATWTSTSFVLKFEKTWTLQSCSGAWPSGSVKNNLKSKYRTKVITKFASGNRLEGTASSFDYYSSLNLSLFLSIYLTFNPASFDKEVHDEPYVSVVLAPSSFVAENSKYTSEFLLHASPLFINLAPKGNELMMSAFSRPKYTISRMSQTY